MGQEAVPSPSLPGCSVEPAWLTPEGSNILSAIVLWLTRMSAGAITPAFLTAGNRCLWAHHVIAGEDMAFLLV